YALIRNAFSSGKATQANTLTDSLQKNHADSAYAVFATTLRAQRQLSAGKAGDAVDSLTWAVEHAEQAPLKNLTRVRLARAELAAGKPEAALKTLDAVPKGAYAGMVAELRGDAQVKQGHADAAVKSYQTAMASFDPDTPQRRILK